MINELVIFEAWLNSKLESYIQSQTIDKVWYWQSKIEDSYVYFDGECSECGGLINEAESIEDHCYDEIRHLERYTHYTADLFNDMLSESIKNLGLKRFVEDFGYVLDADWVDIALDLCHYLENNPDTNRQSLLDLAKNSKELFKQIINGT